MTKFRAKSWARIAAQVAKALPATRLHPRVRTWLVVQDRAAEKWAVAVSGGADSIALLLLLWAHFPKKRKKLFVLHFDHATRRDSGDDAKFVQELARRLQLPFASAQRVGGKTKSEAELREARWEFFREQLEVHRARIIFFGHQRDDVAESMLMRLARGSGAGGLSAPRPVREFPDTVVALRPLLHIKHEELVAALRIVGAPWREDSSNAKNDYLRNRIRHQVIPAWRAAIAPRDLDAGVARSRDALEEDDEALNSIAASIMRDLPAGAPLAFAQLAGQPRAICRRVLWSWLGLNGIEKNLSAQAFDLLLESFMALQSGKWSAGAGRWVVADKDALSILDETTSSPTSFPSASLKPGQTLDWLDGTRLSARVVKLDRKLLKALKNGKVNPAKQVYLAFAEPLERVVLRVRLWRPGDRYQPLGAPGRRKLQDLFTDKKIPARERHRLPLVCSGDDEPYWAPGLSPAHAQRVTAAHHTALELTYHPS